MQPTTSTRKTLFTGILKVILINIHIYYTYIAANLLYGNNGLTKLADFGLARKQIGGRYFYTNNYA